MSKTARFLEQVSIDMGRDGDIDDEVIAEAASRMSTSKAQKRRLVYQLPKLVKPK